MGKSYIFKGQSFENWAILGMPQLISNILNLQQKQ